MGISAKLIQNRGVLVMLGIAVLTIAGTVVVEAIGPDQEPLGTTAPGAHEWRDVSGGDAFCSRCHFTAHNRHVGITFCVDCHAPDADAHVTSRATCLDCHGGHSGFTADVCTGCHTTDGDGNLDTMPDIVLPPATVPPTTVPPTTVPPTTVPPTTVPPTTVPPTTVPPTTVPPTTVTTTP
jgi:hypothetical protein